MRYNKFTLFNLKIMKKFFFVSLFLFSIILFSEELTQNSATQNNKEIATIYPSNDEYVILKGIVISSKKQILVNENYSGIGFYQINIPSGKENLKKILNKFIGRPITDNLIKNLQQDIYQYYKNKKHPLVAVLIPDQDISLGVLQIRIVEARVGEVIVKGNKWTNISRVKKEIHFSPNEPIDEKLLDQDLYWLNRNPFRQAYVVYSPGKSEGTTNIEVVVKDRMPFRGYVGIDNIGNSITGNTRLYTGINIGNLFGNQFFSYQFTTDNEFKRFMAHSGSYKIPLRWRHELSFFGGYSSVDAKFHVKPNPLRFHSKGFASQASMRYDIPLKPCACVLSEVTFGVDFKRTNDALAYGVIQLFPHGHFANLTQMMLGYNIGYYKKFTLTFEIDGFWSPGRWISDQSNSNYNSIRYKAKNHYAYLRSALSFICPIYKKLTWRNYLRWQLANQNLLPSEEYGLGGFDTVRGYLEREVNVDNVIIFNSELHLPFKVCSCKKFRDELDLFVFTDLGYGGENHRAPGERKDYFLASYGPGARYSITPYLIARAEWGFQIKNFRIFRHGTPHQRLHFSVTAGF